MFVRVDHIPQHQEALVVQAASQGSSSLTLDKLDATFVPQEVSSRRLGRHLVFSANLGNI